MRIYDDQLIVITGAAGFIGSGVVRHLNDKGMNNLLLVDHLDSTEKWKNLVGKQFVDILDRDQLFDWLDGREAEVEAFIHLGACSSTVESDASFLLENNYRYTVNLAEYALKHDHRFIYASSAATYGDGSHGFSDDHARLEELRPLNMYGYSKHLFDLWAKQHGVLNSVVGLKYFNVFGPNEYHKGRMASAITHLLPEIKEKGVVKLFKSSEPKYGDGEQGRDFIYVKDVARITCDFLTNDASGIFNVGRGKAETWNTLASAVFRAVDKPVDIQYIDMPADLRGKYQNYTCADMNKIQECSCIDVSTNLLEESVGEYVRDYLLREKRW